MDDDSWNLTQFIKKEHKSDFWYFMSNMSKRGNNELLHNNSTSLGSSQHQLLALPGTLGGLEVKAFPDLRLFEVSRSKPPNLRGFRNGDSVNRIVKFDQLFRESFVGSYWSLLPDCFNCRLNGQPFLQDQIRDNNRRRSVVGPIQLNLKLVGISWCSFQIVSANKDRL